MSRTTPALCFVATIPPMLKDYLDELPYQDYADFILKELYEIVDCEISNIFENQLAHIACFKIVRGGGVEYCCSIGGTGIEGVVGWTPESEEEWLESLEKVIFHKLLKEIGKHESPNHERLSLFSIKKVLNEFPFYY